MNLDANHLQRKAKPFQRFIASVLSVLLLSPGYTAFGNTQDKLNRKLTPLAKAITESFNKRVKSEAPLNRQSMVKIRHQLTNYATAQLPNKNKATIRELNAAVAKAHRTYSRLLVSGTEYTSQDISEDFALEDGQKVCSEETLTGDCEAYQLSRPVNGSQQAVAYYSREENGAFTDTFSPYYSDCMDLERFEKAAIAMVRAYGAETGTNPFVVCHSHPDASRNRDGHHIHPQALSMSLAFRPGAGGCADVDRYFQSMVEDCDRESDASSLKLTGIIAGSVVGGVVGLCALGACFYYGKRAYKNYRGRS